MRNALSQVRDLDAECLRLIAELHGCLAQTAIPYNLAGVRLRYNHAMNGRARFLREVVIPKLEVAGTDAAISISTELKHALADYHAAYASHIARWSLAEVAANWQGYRHTSATKLTARERLLRHESALIGKEDPVVTAPESKPLLAAPR